MAMLSFQASMNEPDRISRKVWLLYPDHVGEVLTGPAVRIMELARLAARGGHEVVLATPRCEQPLPERVVWRPLDDKVFDAIPNSGDAVLVSSEVPARAAWKMCRRGVPFHIDSYNMTAIEVLELGSVMSSRIWYRNLLHRWMKYRALWNACERGYVSTHSQIAFLGGSLAIRPRREWTELARALPEKCDLAPMGIRSDGSREVPDPYPKRLRGRPILLWGGGIWSWFDVDSLLRAMAILKERVPEVALWFLAARNPSGIAIHDEPFERAIGQARELGLLGENVFFNEEKVTPERLPGYLRHCTAGVMANPPRMEAWCSWRTRLLDLLWAGKPLFGMGFDPLSERMHQVGAGTLRPCGDAEGFSSDVAGALGDPSTMAAMAEASKRLGASMTWERTLLPILRSFESPETFRTAGCRPGALDALRFLIAR
jgi:hypothetical protein